jgi:hypothetical protein
LTLLLDEEDSWTVAGAGDFLTLLFSEDFLPLLRSEALPLLEEEDFLPLLEPEDFLADFALRATVGVQSAPKRPPHSSSSSSCFLLPLPPLMLEPKVQMSFQFTPHPMLCLKKQLLSLYNVSDRHQWILFANLKKELENDHLKTQEFLDVKSLPGDIVMININGPMFREQKFFIRICS